MPKTVMSRQVLEAAPVRALVFLNAVGTNPVVRRHLADAGYTDEDHRQGWSLLQNAAGYEPVAPAAASGEGRVKDALAELLRWKGVAVRLTKAALETHHPEQAAFLLGELPVGRGDAAMLGVLKLLGRLDALERGRDPATADADRAALAALDRRGISAAERARLAGLVEIVKKGTGLQAAPGAREPRRETALAALHAWYSGWAATARVSVRRRDLLVRLGLSQRRRTRAKPSES